MFMTTLISNIAIIAIVINVGAGVLITVVTTLTGVCIFVKFPFDHYLQMHTLCYKHAGEN
jgi:hypothetical protein